MYYTIFDTTICDIILAGDEEGLKHLHLKTDAGSRSFCIDSGWHRDDDFFSDAVHQIREYISGTSSGFSISIAADGSDFQKKVWASLLEIPYGETRSYAEIASAIGKHAAVRAVGTAIGRNPIPLIIPCHRVIGSDGRLTGYAFGLKTKETLLELESNGRISL